MAVIRLLKDSEVNVNLKRCRALVIRRASDSQCMNPVRKNHVTCYMHRYLEGDKEATYYWVYQTKSKVLTRFNTQPEAECFLSKIRPYDNNGLPIHKCGIKIFRKRLSIEEIQVIIKEDFNGLC